MPQALSPEDRFAIEDLFARYAWALDTADVEGFADTFVEHGLLVIDMFRRVLRHQGHAALIHAAERLRVREDFPGYQHYGGQLVIDGVDEDGARCRVRSYAFATECKGEPPYAVRFAGHCEDRLVKIDGQWLFEERVVRLWEGEVLKSFPGHGAE